MYAQVEKPKENKCRAIANSVTQKRNKVKQGVSFVDNSPQVVVQRKITKQPKGVKVSPPKQAPVQRHIVNQNEIEGLTADFDSSNLDASIQAIDALTDAAKTDSLKLLRGVLFGKKGANDAALVKYIDSKLRNGAEVLDSAPMSVWEKFWMDFGNQPDVDEDVKKGLNMWVVGDQEKGVNWEMVGKHLRGNLTNEDYKLIGTMHFLKEKVDQNDNGVLIQKGKDILNEVRNDIRGALDALPDFTGRSYRISGIQNNAVFESKIQIGDLIKDATFWSTAAVRGAGAAAADWGQSGTQQKPKAYFIIDGATGKYIAKYSKIEGEREVLFKDHTIFKVNRIVNKTNTFFVYIQEMINVGADAIVKNPYTGDEY